MKKQRKTNFLQIRVTPNEKAIIERQAEARNQGVSQWILSQLIAKPLREFEDLMTSLENSGEVLSQRLIFAAVHDFLMNLGAGNFSRVFENNPLSKLDSEKANVVAAMIETFAHQKNLTPPSWLAAIAPLAKPKFFTQLESLRTYSLIHSPPIFRRRNLFVDGTLGDRV